MNTPENPAPEALQLALAQIAAVLKTNGVQKLDDLIKEKDGYIQIIWLLEKLAKASLDWEQLGHPSAIEAPGLSSTTQHELQLKLESLN